MPVCVRCKKPHNGTRKRCPSCSGAIPEIKRRALRRAIGFCPKCGSKPTRGVYCYRHRNPQRYIKRALKKRKRCTELHRDPPKHGPCTVCPSLPRIRQTLRRLGIRSNISRPRYLRTHALYRATAIILTRTRELVTLSALSLNFALSIRAPMELFVYQRLVSEVRRLRIWISSHADPEPPIPTLNDFWLLATGMPLFPREFLRND